MGFWVQIGRKERMKSKSRKIRKGKLRQRLLLPFAAVLVIVPLIDLLAFNYFINKYISDSVSEQLIHTAVSSKVLIKKELSEIVFETDAEKIGSVLSDVNRILRSTKTNMNVELMLYAETGELLYPSSYSDTFLNDEITAKIRDILRDLDDVEPVVIKAGKSSVAAAGYRLSELPISSIPYVVFTSSLNIADELIGTVNRVLVIVLLAGLASGMILAALLSEKIVRSVREIREGARGLSLFRKYIPSERIETDELNELAGSIADASDKIIRYDSAQKSFLQNASHEIRTPLMSIRGYAEGIERNMFPDPAKAAGVVNDESIRLSKLLDELLMISRIDNGNYDASFECVSLKGVMMELGQSIKGLSIRNDKEFEIRLPDDDHIIRYNETLFSQMVMNPVANAFRYAENKVEMYVKESDGVVCICIKDDGPGISEEDLPHVFERFYKGRDGQTGLGLAIAETATEALGGEITAANSEKGAVFTIKIPLCPDVSAQGRFAKE